VKVNTEKLEGSKVSLEVEAPKEVVVEAINRAYKRIVRRVDVPGFRRGRAPRIIFERYYGRETLYEEALKEVLPQQYMKAVDESNIEPVDDPEFVDVHFKEGEPLRFKAVVFVRPEVTLEDYDDISVPFETPSVTEEDIQKQIEILRERLAELRPLDENAVLKEGHYANCHVRGIEGGDFKVEFDSDLNYVEVGRDLGFIPGLSQALVDMKKGDVKEFTGEYKKEGEEPKKACFEVEVKEIYEKRLPESLEELAKNLGKATPEEVREEIKKDLLDLRMRMAGERHLDKVEEALLEKASVDIPKVMIQRRVDEIYQRFEQRLRETNTTMDKYLELTGRPMEDLLAEMEKEAEKDVKRELVLDAIAEKENIKVPEETVDRVLATLARETGREPNAVKTTLEIRGTLSDIRRQLTRIETLKKIAEKAAINAGTPIPEQVKEQPQTAGEEKEPTEQSEGKMPTQEESAVASDSEGDQNKADENMVDRQKPVLYNEGHGAECYNGNEKSYNNPGNSGFIRKT